MENTTTTPVVDNSNDPAYHASSVVAFIIGLAIILLASVLNAAGLNLTKLDHVRTNAVPKASRRRDLLRPLWLLGMLLYMCVACVSLHRNPTDAPPHRLSQLIGSTLALEYMRAGMWGTRLFSTYFNILDIEYVAPLGSTSLVFNFLFARFLVGTPVTSTDIYVSTFYIVYHLISHLRRVQLSLFWVSLAS